MSEPLFPLNVDIGEFKVTPRSKYRPPENIRIVRGREAEKIVNKTLPILYTRRSIYNLVEPPSAVYYRVYKSNDGYGVFYLFVWPDQKVPPHKWDYEPVIVLTDKRGNPREIYTDGYHYFISKTKLPHAHNWWIEIDAPWRTMRVRIGTPDDMVLVYPVAEGRGLGPKPLYLSDRIIAELRSRRENPLKINSKLIRDPWSVRKAEHWMTYRAPTPEELMYDILENYGLAKYVKGQLSLRLVLKLMRMKSFIMNLINRVRSIMYSVGEKIGIMNQLGRRTQESSL